MLSCKSGSGTALSEGGIDALAVRIPFKDHILLDGRSVSLE